MSILSERLAQYDVPQKAKAAGYELVLAKGVVLNGGTDITATISKEVKKQRITNLVALQNSITKESTKIYLGKEVEILVEGYDEKRNLYLGRDVYNRMGYFPCEEDLIGQFVTKKIERGKGVSLFWELIRR